MKFALVLLSLAACTSLISGTATVARADDSEIPTVDCTGSAPTGFFRAAIRLKSDGLNENGFGGFNLYEGSVLAGYVGAKAVLNDGVLEIRDQATRAGLAPSQLVLDIYMNRPVAGGQSKNAVLLRASKSFFYQASDELLSAINASPTGINLSCRVSGFGD